MFDPRALILISATIFGCLAEHESLRDHYQNLNNNLNYNQAYGGSKGAQGKDFLNNRDRDNIYAKRTKPRDLPKYSNGLDPTDIYRSLKLRDSAKLADQNLDPKDIYHALKYIIRGNDGVVPESAGKFRLRDSGLSTDSPVPELPPGFGFFGDHNSESCDSILREISRYGTDEEGRRWVEAWGPDDSVLRYQIDLPLLLNGKKDSNKKTSGGKIAKGGGDPLGTWIPIHPSQYMDRDSIRIHSKIPSKHPSNLKPSPGLSTLDLSGLQMDYITDSPLSYVIEHQPPNAADRQPSYVYGRQPSYATERQPSYVIDLQSPNVDRKKNPAIEQPIHPGDVGAYPAALPSVDDDYDAGHQDTNMNSNVNYNVMGAARRSNNNVNSNANTNAFQPRDRGMELPHGERRYHPQPHVGSYDEIPRSRPRQYRRPPLKFYGRNDDDDDDDDDDDYIPYGNTNVNSNTNTNIIARRNNPRNRRSVDEKLTKKIDADAQATKKEDSKTSSPSGPPIQKRKGPAHTHN